MPPSLAIKPLLVFTAPLTSNLTVGDTPMPTLPEPVNDKSKPAWAMVVFCASVPPSCTLLPVLTVSPLLAVTPAPPPLLTPTTRQLPLSYKNVPKPFAGMVVPANVAGSPSALNTYIIWPAVGVGV